MTRITRGATNVSVDLGYPDDAERQTKARLALAVNELLNGHNGVGVFRFRPRFAMETLFRRYPPETRLAGISFCLQDAPGQERPHEVHRGLPVFVI